MREPTNLRISKNHRKGYVSQQVWRFQPGCASLDVSVSVLAYHTKSCKTIMTSVASIVFPPSQPSRSPQHTRAGFRHSAVLAADLITNTTDTVMDACLTCSGGWNFQALLCTCRLGRSVRCPSGELPRPRRTGTAE